MDIQKEKHNYLAMLVAEDAITQEQCSNLSLYNGGNYFHSDFLASSKVDCINWGFSAWLKAKAQAVQEQDQQVFATSNLTWKDITFRALSCKVLKSTENWVHVKNIACVGSTTASLICKKLGVDPDGTKFELIEAQEPANDSH